MATKAKAKTKVAVKPVVRKKIPREEIDKLNGFTPRVQKLKQAWMDFTTKVCSDRGYYYMESWKSTEGEHEAVRVAKMFANWCEKCRIAIHDGELLVGAQTHWPRGTVPRPESLPAPLLYRLREVEEKLATVATNVPAVIDEFELKRLEESCEYFQNYFEALEKRERDRGISKAPFRTRWEATRTPIITAEDNARQLIHLGAHGGGPMSEGQIRGLAQPGLVLGSDKAKVLAKGFNGIIAEVEERIEGIKRKYRENVTPEDLDAIEVLNSWIIALEGMITYSRRHAALAREKAAKETDPKRKKELLKIADVCENVPANPARDFHEALQSLWYIHVGQEIEKTAANAMIGRVDQHWFPYYEKSINEGIHTRQECAELLGCMFVKWQTLEAFTPYYFIRLVPGSYLANVNVGGFNRLGKDASNELSVMILHVAKQVKTNSPHISLQWHRAMAPELLDKAIECTRDHGGGIPAWFNANVVIQYLVDRGIPLDEAREDGTVLGCVNIGTGKGYSYDRAGGMGFVNHAKLLEMALNRGVDPHTGFKLGPDTGDPREFKTFEEVEEAYKQQVLAHIEYTLSQFKGLTLECLFESRPFVPFTSPMSDDCIGRAKDLLKGGMRFYENLCGGGWTDRAQSDVSDSLVAIKKVVFDDKAATMGELLDALKANWEGYDELRAKCRAAPKYGNDDDYADDIHCKWWDYTKELTKYQRDFKGFRMSPHRQGAGWAQMCSPFTGSLPNGHKAGEWLSDAAVSPCKGVDKKGPTAMLNSAAKLDPDNCEAPLLNMRLTPEPLRSREGMRKFGEMLGVFFDRGAAHVQFTILSRETLLDAKAHPENYRNLVVRVAGYSAFWVELTPQVQEEIIQRTDHTI